MHHSQRNAGVSAMLKAHGWVLIVCDQANFWVNFGGINSKHNKSDSKSYLYSCYSFYWIFYIPSILFFSNEELKDFKRQAKFNRPV